MTPFCNPEVGRELKVSELKLKTVVVIWKQGRPPATLWVIQIAESFVHFFAGEANINFLAKRAGEGITDDDGLPMKVFEYLGKV